MVYRPSIPASTDIISKSQVEIRNNFSQVYDAYGRPSSQEQNDGDHIPLNDADEIHRGGHKQTTLVLQSSDPSPGANELDLYSSDNSGTTELFYIRNGDASGNQLTSIDRVNYGGVVLQAYVLFDELGNILQREIVQEDGSVTKEDIAFNVSSVVPTVAPTDTVKTDEWLISFTNALPTQEYFWIFKGFVKMEPGRNIFINAGTNPKAGASYGDSVNTTSFLGSSWNLGSIPATNTFNRIFFKAYTVAA